MLELSSKSETNLSSEEPAMPPPIREAQPADIPAIVELIRNVAAENRWVRVETPFDAPARERHLTARMASGEIVAFIAESADAIVGELTLRIRNERAVFGMVVAAAHRRHGIGRALVTAAIAQARERAVTSIEIEVYTHNQAALRLYRTTGFTPHGTPIPEPRPNGQHWTIQRMRHNLA
jgi:ribosomal protein S18 acetylase RimI-like enzyme